MAVRVCAAGLAGFWGYFFFGLMDLAVPLDQTPGFDDSYLLETGWGLMSTAMVVVPLVALAVKPGLFTPLIQPCRRQLRRTGGGSTGSRNAPRLGAAAGLYLTAGILAWLVRRGGHWRPERSLARGFRGLLVLALMAVPAVGVAALGQRGWRVSSSTVGVAAAWFGTLSVLYPVHAESLGFDLGVAAICWGVLVLVVGEIESLTHRGEGHEKLGQSFSDPCGRRGSARLDRRTIVGGGD